MFQKSTFWIDPMEPDKGSSDRPSIPGQLQLYIFDPISFYFFQRSLCIQLHYTHLPNKFFKTHIFICKKSTLPGMSDIVKIWFSRKQLFIEFKSFVKFPFTFSHEKWRDKQMNHLWQNKTCYDKAWKAHFTAQITDMANSRAYGLE